MDDEELFLGYCYFPNGMHTEAVHLHGIKATAAYIRLQMPIQHKVVICDNHDHRIFVCLQGQVIFPIQSS